MDGNFWHSLRTVLKDVRRVESEEHAIQLAKEAFDMYDHIYEQCTGYTKYIKTIDRYTGKESDSFYESIYKPFYIKLIYFILHY